MKLKQIFTETFEDPFTILESLEPENMTEQEAKESLKHLQKQFKVRYRYLVGEWRSARRAKSTLDGQFVSSQEVKDYLDNKTK